MIKLKSRLQVTATLLSLAILAVEPITADAKEPIWTDELWYLYDEANSCAVYADYPDGGMFRIAYKASEEIVYVNYFSPNLVDMIIGEQLTIVIGSEADPVQRRGFPAKVVSNGNDKGIAFSSPPDLIEFLGSTKKLSIFGPGLVPIARLTIPDTEQAFKLMKVCGRSK
ncbi:MAG: hypothetical protein CL949_10100 [Erythrobacter sp.]|nr:hypothetical protein [Erythrobacter sp.]